GADDPSRIDTRVLGSCVGRASGGLDASSLKAFLRGCYQAGLSGPPPTALPASGTSPTTPLPQPGQSDVTRFVKGLFDRGELAPLLGLDDPSRIDTRVLGACMTKLAQSAADSGRLAALLRECYQSVITVPPPNASPFSGPTLAGGDADDLRSIVQ